MIGDVHASTAPQSPRWEQMLATRLPTTSDAVPDDPAPIVLGPRLHALCVALGVPARDWLRLAQVADAPIDQRALDALHTYVDVLVADRCRCPGQDLVSDLVAYDAGGRGLTADEISAIVVALLTA